MGKTPKKAAPGGDERNLYVRRLKATTASSRAESSSLPERQRESESTNRPKLSGVQKRISAGSGKNLKSKLRTSKVGINQVSKQLKLPMKNPESTTTNMQPQSEEAEVKLNVSIQKEDYSRGAIQEENGNNKAVEIVPDVNKEFVEHGAFEQMYEFQTPLKDIQEVEPVETEVAEVSQEKEGVSIENNAVTKEMEEQDENDLKLMFETDQSPVKNGEESPNNEQQPTDNNKEEELSAAQTEDELKNGIKEKEDESSEAQTNNGSCSVDIVESAISDVSETPEFVQSEVQKAKAKPDDTVNNESISYDSSITLKNVEIRLNDCLRDSSHEINLTDPNRFKDIELRITKYLTKEVSYPQTLANLSGRRPYSSRRPYDTLRERRISPNSSLFVNTSAVSLDEGAEAKALRYSSMRSSSFPTNGSPMDKKRKIDAEDCSSAKKQKLYDDNRGLLNTSTNLLRSFYKPVMKVSTPKAASRDFEPSKLDISGIKDDDNTKMAKSTESTKKWCVVM